MMTWFECIAVFFFRWIPAFAGMTKSNDKEEITILKRPGRKYRTQKRGLMQKLLTGKWRIKQ